MGHALPPESGRTSVAYTTMKLHAFSYVILALLNTMHYLPRPLMRNFGYLVNSAIKVSAQQCCHQP